MAKEKLCETRPDLKEEWFFEKNNELGFDYHKYTVGSKEKVWWKCKKDDRHVWGTQIKARTKENGTNCPYCSGNKVLKDFNDMWTTNPKLASMLLDKEVGYIKMEQSTAKTDWICQECGGIVRQKVISSVRNRGLCCPICSDSIPLSEKIMSAFLSNIKVDFESQKIFSWLPNKRYDFYIPELSMIIETHGEQHIREGFIRAGGKSLKEVQENDRIKEIEARKNGIKHYIAVDCSKSEFDFIKHSIENSELSTLLTNEVDWEKVAENSAKSMMYSVWEMWNNGERSIKKIGQALSLGTQVVNRYLKQGSISGKCTYEKGVSLRAKDYNKKRVLQLTPNEEPIKEWNSIKEASDCTGVVSSNISGVCRGERQTAGGFKWRYL